MKFGTKYLVFDFDFQEKTFPDSDKADILRQMIQVFDNESENGLLFINYPMFESFQEKNGSAQMMESNKVKQNSLATYKESISKRKLMVNCKTITHSTFKSFILTALKESNYILNGVFSRKLPFQQLVNGDYGQRISEKQKEQLDTEDSIYTINTSVLIPIFYFGERKYRFIS